MPDEFWLRRAETHALTSRGADQAVAGGRLLREAGLDRHDLYLVSPMRRAMHTAALLGLAEPGWQIAGWLAERAWGPRLRTLDAGQRETFLAAARRESSEDPWFWVPEGGESLAAAASRAYSGLAARIRDRRGASVLVVAHGELIRGLRCLLQPGLDPDSSDNTLGNGQFVCLEWDTADPDQVRVLDPGGQWTTWAPVGYDSEELLRLASGLQPREGRPA
ncbi:histidine phosphatase family protein [Kitasatospora sp. NBC_01287]|uniref:phosphoglycerate mutase family protein n=1 Tax=Kitasatospora sp. NBC_01287 TaxID=2903573 RepID=UPI00225333A5|nr:phosphoglycerate mutase family protein [Kitasatospora sp. NBC_01287]MCX4749339.1 histidine phosphatase family protein [Kitasatospora sp. NBC_01287]